MDALAQYSPVGLALVVILQLVQLLRMGWGRNGREHCADHWEIIIEVKRLSRLVERLLARFDSLDDDP